MRYSIVLIIVALSFNLNGQTTIGLNEVVTNTLQHNLNVKIAQNVAQLAENSATLGNAGGLPTVTAGAGVNGQLTNTNLVFAGGAQPPIEVTGAQTIVMTGNLTASYVLFNGFTASNTFGRLELQSELATAQSQLQIEAILLQSINAYFGALQLQSSLSAAKRSLEISLDRYQRALLRADYGSSNSIVLLNSEVDLKNDSITVINIEQQLANAKSTLAYLMGVDNINFELDQGFEMNNEVSKEELLDQALSQNLSMLEARKNLEISEKSIDISNGSYYPSLSISSGYSYSNNQSDASFIIENVNSGLNGAISLNYSLFNGGRSSIARENAKINWETSKLRIDDLTQSLKTQINNAYTTYTNNLNVVELRNSTLLVNQKNFSRSEQLYKNGQITGTEFREAQLNLLNAEIQLYVSRINAKLSEYELVRLSGNLVSTQ
ncbi:MAG: TolC family protein [Bacteroidia bacterium]